MSGYSVTPKATPYETPTRTEEQSALLQGGPDLDAIDALVAETTATVEQLDPLKQPWLGTDEQCLALLDRVLPIDPEYPLAKVDTTWLTRGGEGYAWHQSGRSGLEGPSASGHRPYPAATPTRAARPSVTYRAARTTHRSQPGEVVRQRRSRATGRMTTITRGAYAHTWLLTVQGEAGSRRFYTLDEAKKQARLGTLGDPAQRYVNGGYYVPPTPPAQ